MGLSDLIPEPDPLPERIMGIDASSKSVAFSLFDGDKLLHWGKLYIKGDDTAARCGDINKKMYHLMKLYEPDMVVMEQAIFVNNRRVVIDLANVYGSILGVAVATGHPCAQVVPTAWMAHIGNPARNSKEMRADVKKEFPGKSKTWYTNKLREWRKERTRQWVIDALGPTIDDDDVTDACAIGWYGVDKYGKA